MGRLIVLLAVAMVAGMTAVIAANVCQVEQDAASHATTANEQALPRSSPGALPALDEPLHWSAKPHLMPTNEIILTRFLRFETRDGRFYNAKMFLIEFRPEKLPEEERQRQKGAVPRIVCLGYEIKVDEGYQPEIEVPSRYVQQTSPASYRLTFGMLTCDVRLSRRPAEQ